MEYQKNFLERRHTEVCTWFPKFRIDHLEYDQVFDLHHCGHAWLWLMLVQLLHLIPERLLDLQSACARMDMWGFSKLAEVLCGAVGSVYQISRKTRLQLFSLCTRGCRSVSAVHCSRKKWNQQQSKRNSEIDTRESFFLLSTTISSSRIGNKSSTSQTSLSKEMICLADHRSEKNSNEYIESILWLYLFCDRIISSEKRVQIYWITDLFVSAPNLPRSSVCFRLEQPKLVQNWYPSMSVRNAD